MPYPVAACRGRSSTYVSGVTTLVYDTFTDTNGTVISSHTPNIDLEGGGWADVRATGDAGDFFDIQSNKLAREASNNAIAYIDSGQADVTVSADCTTESGGDDAVAINVRYKDHDNRWRIRIRADLDNVRITEENGGGVTDRATTSVTIDRGTEYALEVVTNNETITATVDGGNQVQYTSAAFQKTETIHGLEGGNNNTELFDNFLVTT